MRTNNAQDDSVYTKLGLISEEQLALGVNPEDVLTYLGSLSTIWQWISFYVGFVQFMLDCRAWQRVRRFPFIACTLTRMSRRTFCSTRSLSVMRKLFATYKHNAYTQSGRSDSENDE